MKTDWSECQLVESKAGVLGWPDQLENGELLSSAEQSGFDPFITSDENIRYQQNLTGQSYERTHGEAIRAAADGAKPGNYLFITALNIAPKRFQECSLNSKTQPGGWVCQMNR